jgi:hypothetical protein
MAAVNELSAPGRSRVATASGPVQCLPSAGRRSTSGQQLAVPAGIRSGENCGSGLGPADSDVMLAFAGARMSARASPASASHAVGLRHTDRERHPRPPRCNTAAGIDLNNMSARCRQLQPKRISWVRVGPSASGPNLHPVFRATIRRRDDTCPPPPAGLPTRLHSKYGLHGRRPRRGPRLRLLPQVFANGVALLLHVPEHQHAELVGIASP